jgi:hypothetical protein
MATVDKSPRRKAASQEELDRWRSLRASDVVLAFATYTKIDPTYVAVADSTSERWHAEVGGQHRELLLTGPKFWDTHEQRGGGGAVDLVMHMLACDFRRAVSLLRGQGL